MTRCERVCTGHSSHQYALGMVSCITNGQILKQTTIEVSELWRDTVAGIIGCVKFKTVVSECQDLIVAGQHWTTQQAILVYASCLVPSFIQATYLVLFAGFMLNTVVICFTVAYHAEYCDFRGTVYVQPCQSQPAKSRVFNLVQNLHRRTQSARYADMYWRGKSRYVSLCSFSCLDQHGQWSPGM